jgi:putative ABC transport system permease protein
MNLHLRPMISAMLCNRAGPLLVAMQVAIALAVLANAVYIVSQRIAHILRPTGMEMSSTFVISSQGFAQSYDHTATIREDLSYLRNVPGVLAAAPINAVPMSGDGLATVLSTRPGDTTHTVGANLFESDEAVLAALGLKLVAGRAFRADEVLPVKLGEGTTTNNAQLIVTRALAEKLFPSGNALGNSVYDSMNVLTAPATIVGIVENVRGSWPESPDSDELFFIPRTPFPYDNTVNYLVRTQPADRDQIMTLVEEHMTLSNPTRVLLWTRPLEFFKDRSNATDRNMSYVLGVVTALLLGVAALGVYGLTAYNVSIRRKQIGTRRALGARRFDILSYFMIENWLVTTAGLIAGCALSIAIGYFLSVNYGLPRLQPVYLAAGMLTLWIIGELAAWMPARRAASISPAVATRTV